jgi:hypothetical protein
MTQIKAIILFFLLVAIANVTTADYRCSSSDGELCENDDVKDGCETDCWDADDKEQCCNDCCYKL